MTNAKIKQNPKYVLEPSDQEMRAVYGIIDRFAKTIRDAPEPLPFLETIYLGCTADAVILSDEPFDCSDDAMPPVALFTTIDSMSEGSFDAVTPPGFHYMMFQGPETKEIIWSLAMVLVWERDRPTNGEVAGVHLTSIRENLSKVLQGLNANASVADIG